MDNKTIFQTLSEIDISPKIKQKNKMDYLPWSSAWDFVKNKYPTATYSIVKNEEGCIYHNDGRTCWVETSMTIDGETQTEILPVLNFRNEAIGYDKVTTSDVNKSIKRCLVKNLALFGLGLSLWNGEELSDNAKKKQGEDEKALREAQNNLVELMKTKIADGCDRDKLSNLLEKIIGHKNPNNVKDIDVLVDAVSKINEITPEKL